MVNQTEIVKEKIKEDFSIFHKITSANEQHNFHIHDEFEIMLILSDGMMCAVGEQTYMLPKNSLLLFNNMDLHMINTVKPGPSERYVVSFRPEYLELLSSDKTNLLECFFFRPTSDPNLLPLSDGQASLLTDILVRITDYRSPENAQLYGSDLFVKILLIELLLRVNAMYRDYHNITAPTISQNYSLVYNVMIFIHKYYWDDITLDTLSQQFYINKFYLCSLFKSVTGTSPNQYLINCRLMKAKELLLNHMTVEQVCSQVGYNNLSHFSRAFKKHTGMSPKQFQMAALHR